MKRNITPPIAQSSLFGDESATAVLPPPKTPRARAAAKTSSAAAPVAAEAKTAKIKMAKTNHAFSAVPNSSVVEETPAKALVSLKAAPAPKSVPVKLALASKDIASAKMNVTVKAAAPIKTDRSKTADGNAKQKIAKTNAQPKKSLPATPTVRVVNEPVFEGGMLWKMSGRNGVAYIKDAALAGELLAIDPKKLSQAAMAVYYDKKGKAFAWQVRFDTDRWDEVMRRLG